ncbi:cytochrome P450 [Actinocatenispora rupis]|uniref:Cytochrome P450 n=1 Tax=Actinocatenispora rupis TaxID=519421 RepID=A0A8J3ND58_9ACTN|nr:cytochrome P450 [Actinocatenispora rupis]GID12532.1 cytochrome P450 [Actinocatenispora rupis]
MPEPTHCPFPRYPFRRDDPLAPPPEYRELRAASPSRVLLPDGSTPWLLTRHADVRAAMSDPRLSADDRDPAYPRLVGAPRVSGWLSFLRMDGAAHARLRRMLIGEFTVRRVDAMRPGVQAAVDRLLDALADRPQPADLLDAFALPLPSMVICQLLGVPYADREFFQRHSRTLVSVTATPEEAATALRALDAYLDGLVAEKRRRPGDDLLSRVTAARIETGELLHDELVGMARLLLVAGHETTANMLGLGVLLLLRRPAALRALRTDRALVRPAVEELLRYLSVVQTSVARVATVDVEIGGAEIAAGEGVVLAIPAANHDEVAFVDPDVLDLRRDPRHHVAFGYGVHQCIGQGLARVELDLALVSLLTRLPDLRLGCDPADLTFRHDSVVYGLAALPVRWD